MLPLASNKKIKLLVVVPSLECGGVERNVSIICNHIHTDQFDVTLAILNNSNPFFSISNPAVKVIDLGVGSVRKSLFAITKLTRTIKPDILLTTANHLNLFFAIFRWLFPSRIRIIARESSIVSVNTRHAKMPDLYDRLLKKFYKRLDLIVCQSNYMQYDLQKHYLVPVEKTAIIYNPVFKPNGQNEIKKSDQHPQYITVSRLSAEKGIDRLIRAVSMLDFPFTFTIIGDGPLRQELFDLVKQLNLHDKIVFAGRKDQPFVVVPNPDLFLMGSHYEGFPNAALEASSLGIPVIAFDAPGGISEVVQAGKTGLLVENGQIEEFANAIKQTLTTQFNKAEISAYTLSKFNIDSIINQWESILKPV